MSAVAARMPWRVRKSICVHLCPSVVSLSSLGEFRAHAVQSQRRSRGERGGLSVTGPTEPHPAYVIVGVSHRTGTAALRERLFVDEAGQIELLAALRAANLDQALVLSTCDRTELHAIAGNTAGAAAAMREILARQGCVAAADIAAQGYELSDAAA